MTDPYRTAVNPYSAMAAEARAKLESDRIAVNELEAQREVLLAEVNAGLAPFRVYRKQGGTSEPNTVRLTHPSSSLDLGICYEDVMLEDLPRRISTAAFAKVIEAVEADVKKRAARVEADVKKRAARRAMLRRAVEPVSLAVVGTVLVSALHYALDGDFEWGRLAFVLTCSLAFNFWYLGTFKRSPP